MFLIEVELNRKSFFKKVITSNLFLISVCGTTGKRKACKDCSCGLKEELEGEEGEPAKKSVESSCGSVSSF